MEAGNTTISVEKTFNASVEKVWQAWIDPVLINWFGSDPNGKVLKAALDVRPGGSFEITFNDGDGTEHTCSGIYHEVQPYSRLAFTWSWKSEPGVESFVIVSFNALGNATQLHLEHIDPGTASAHDYIRGWQDTFSKLERTLINA